MSVIDETRSVWRAMTGQHSAAAARERLSQCWAPMVAEVDLPRGAMSADIWEGDYPERVVLGRELGVTACPITVQASAVQNAMGNLRGRIVSIEGSADRGLQAWQARALAAQLLAAADQLDAWAR